MEEKSKSVSLDQIKEEIEEIHEEVPPNNIDNSNTSNQDQNIN